MCMYIICHRSIFTEGEVAYLFHRPQIAKEDVRATAVDPVENLLGCYWLSLAKGTQLGRVTHLSSYFGPFSGFLGALQVWRCRCLSQFWFLPYAVSYLDCAALGHGAKGPRAVGLFHFASPRGHNSSCGVPFLLNGQNIDRI